MSDGKEPPVGSTSVDLLADILGELRDASVHIEPWDPAYDGGWIQSSVMALVYPAVAGVPALVQFRPTPSVELAIAVAREAQLRLRRAASGDETVLRSWDESRTRRMGLIYAHAAGERAEAT